MSDTKMPVLFVGHGSPMNAIEDNQFTRSWESLAKEIPEPKAILAVSAHWYTRGSKIMDTSKPRQIYDMYGFPDALYNLRYEPQGSPLYAKATQELIEDKVSVDNTWGIDHGTWSVLCKMYPEANIPVFQLSVDATAPATEHFKLGQDLQSLRMQDVLILGSGNVVHNLARVNWQMPDSGYDWAHTFDEYIKNNIEDRKFSEVIDYKKAGAAASLAFTMPDHFYPLLYVLGASDAQDELEISNEECTLGSLSMTSYLFK